MSDTPDFPQLEDAKSNAGTMIAVGVGILVLLGAIYYFMRPDSMPTPITPADDTSANESDSTNNEVREILPNQLENTQWSLVSYSDKNSREVKVPSDSGADSNFTTNRIDGSGGCNNYFGSYSSTGNTVSVGPLGMTFKSCGITRDTSESEFMRNLSNSTTFEISGNVLTMYDNSGKVTLKYSREN